MTTVLANLALTMALLTLLWGLSVRLRDVSIIDPYWGFGFAIVAWATFLLERPTGARSILICSLTTLWGLRLSGYLLWRNWGHEEDRRYRAMRDARGESFWYRSLWIVFWLQAALLWIISFPVQITMIADKTAPLGILDWMGVLVWAIGFTFETVGDFQLSRFKADPANKGKVFDRGLWRYTRHPNYFGDFCIWWGLYMIAVSAGAWWTFFGPLLMSFFLLKVSGVAMLERTITERRPGYQEYIEKTNAFFPGPRRK